jgi:hypothetical protein
MIKLAYDPDGRRSLQAAHDRTSGAAGVRPTSSCFVVRHFTADSMRRSGTSHTSATTRYNAIDTHG